MVDEPDKRESVTTVLSYRMGKESLILDISFCVDAKEMYDFILLKTVDFIDGLQEMVEYRLIGSDLFGTIVKWTQETGWESLPKPEVPIYYDIRDCYAIVCDYKSEGWKLAEAF